MTEEKEFQIIELSPDDAALTEVTALYKETVLCDFIPEFGALGMLVDIAWNEKQETDIRRSWLKANAGRRILVLREKDRNGRDRMRGYVEFEEPHGDGRAVLKEWVITRLSRGEGKGIALLTEAVRKMQEAGAGSILAEGFVKGNSGPIYRSLGGADGECGVRDFFEHEQETENFLFRTDALLQVLRSKAEKHRS